jgi:hypothetical protein
MSKVQVREQARSRNHSKSQVFQNLRNTKVKSKARAQTQAQAQVQHLKTCHVAISIAVCSPSTMLCAWEDQPLCFVLVPCEMEIDDQFFASSDVLIIPFNGIC